MARSPQGQAPHRVHLEGKAIQSRCIWRLPGLRQAVYPGIQEGFVVRKTNMETLESDLQYFITNRPPKAWDSQMVLDRILLHWDTETGVFGIKDNTFHEDKVRYGSLQGAMAHVSLLHIAWDGLSAPVFERYWRGEPMSRRIRFWKDHPEYNPFSHIE